MSAHGPTRIAPATPSDAPDEAAASPIFIRNAVYGTRCSTIVAIDGAGNGVIAERRFDSSAKPAGETTIRFTWPS